MRYRNSAAERFRRGVGFPRDLGEVVLRSGTGVPVPSPGWQVSAARPRRPISLHTAVADARHSLFIHRTGVGQKADPKEVLA
jgi:hypothetical protein